VYCTVYLDCLIYISPLLFFFNPNSITEFYSLSLHDALPILSFSSSSRKDTSGRMNLAGAVSTHLGHVGTSPGFDTVTVPPYQFRSEEHTSELQSRFDLVCRLLLEKKKTFSLELVKRMNYIHI